MLQEMPDSSSTGSKSGRYDRETNPDESMFAHTRQGKMPPLTNREPINDSQRSVNSLSTSEVQLVRVRSDSHSNGSKSLHENAVFLD
jgi:hypothetical protein